MVQRCGLDLQSQLKNLNDSNLERIDLRFDAFESRMDAFESRMDAFESRMEARFEKFRSEMLLWMFAFWSATVIPLIGVMLALSGAFHR